MRILASSLAVLTLLALTGPLLFADDPAPMASDATPDLNGPDLIRLVDLPRLDRGKGFIERPIERLLAVDPNNVPVVAPQPSPNTPEFVPKKRIEAPVKRVLSVSSPPADLRKMLIQSPLENIVEQTTSPAPVAADEVNLDERKDEIESPVKALVNADAETNVEPPQPVERSRDGEKRIIELPVKNLVHNKSVQLDEEIVDIASEESSDDNPQVAPGKVAWHGDFAAACRAAEDSGKPVLLFHLMGQLDQRFT